MRRVKLLQGVRIMRFAEAFDGWQERQALPLVLSPSPRRDPQLHLGQELTPEGRPATPFKRVGQRL